MRNVFVAETAFDRLIRTSPEPAPAIGRPQFFGVNGEVDFATAEQGVGNAKDKFGVDRVDLESLSRFAFAPAPSFPSSEERDHLSASGLGREKEVRFEGKKSRRPFLMPAARQNGRANLAGGPARDENAWRAPARASRPRGDLQARRGT